MERLIYTVVLCYCVSSVLITQSSAAAGADCTTNPTTVCVDVSQEVCENNVCICKPTFVNIGGTCTAFDCTGVTNACKNGGTCPAGETACSCVAGWAGDDCGRATLGVDCSGGTACTDANNEVCGTGDKCACKPGFEDDSGTCKDIDECATNPCQNDGSCDNEENAYTCTCVAGYEGTNCETDVDDCKPDPCLNGATCLDAVNSYTCTCATGWKGTKCERAIVGACTGDTPACPATINNGECSGMDCVCKEGYQKEEDNCVLVPDNSAGKIAMTAVTMLMAVLPNIIIQMF